MQRRWHRTKTWRAHLGFLTAVIAISFLQSPAQTNRSTLPRVTPGPQPSSTNTPPTTTVETGDQGGKFFGAPPDASKVRRYFIAAESGLWDYMPLGSDVICGQPVPPPILTRRRGSKIRYVEYLDESFSTRAFPERRLGIMGPVLRGVVGDFLVVTFLNRTSRPLSMHPHGVKYDKDSEGAYYLPRPGLGAAIGPKARFTYVWKLDEGSGPLPAEPSSKAWLYHSHVDPVGELNLGLAGAIIVTDPSRARPDGTPADIDREMATLFMIFDESGMGEAEKEAAEYGSLPGGIPQRTWAEVQEVTERGERNTINGYVFGNLPGLDMMEGERVRWYMFGLGSENDFHTPHWHGMKVLEEGRRQTDVIELLPASMKVADMLADNPGNWLLECHVANHMAEGMFAQFTVLPKGLKAPAEPPFFGTRQSRASLEIQRLSVTRAEPAGFELQMEGRVTVSQAFSAFIIPVSVKLGDRVVQFKPDRSGRATNGMDSFWVKNASQYGVVYGGHMEFETRLRDPKWISELKKPGNDVQAKSLTIIMQVGNAEHKAMAEVRPSSRGTDEGARDGQRK
ncbi:MAG: multicopper oxidase domain-containing protein [Verrucomicrobia subdivision 3 bacterium]|nr:multicopper oxidase domain-containing protein [Limisphaerales bacterium]